MSYTPDSLRALGDAASSRRLSPMEVHAHADAWEADLFSLADITAFHAYDHDKVEKLEADNTALRERLRKVEAESMEDCGSLWRCPLCGEATKSLPVKHAGNCPYASQPPEESGP